MPNIESVADAPFRRSWIDRLIDWIDRLPGPAWLLYGLVVLATALLINAVLWIDGSVPVGAAGSIKGIFPPYVFYFLALYHYLTRVGTKSLRAFRPLLDQDDAAVARIAHGLANLPRRWGRWAILLGFMFLPPYLLRDPLVYGELVPRTTLPYALASGLAAFNGATFMCVVIRSVRQAEAPVRTARISPARRRVFIGRPCAPGCGGAFCRCPPEDVGSGVGQVIRGTGVSTGRGPRSSDTRDGVGLIGCQRVIATCYA